MISNARRVVQIKPTTQAAPMTNQRQPIQVPMELMREWCGMKNSGRLLATDLINAFRRAAQWGRDQQLDECCEYLKDSLGPAWAVKLRDACRRPKVDDSEAADAARMRWMLQGNGYFMEEAGLCGHGPCDEQDMNDARREIDKRMAQDK